MRVLEEFHGFDPARFLKTCWNRQPCLIRDWLRPDPVELATMLERAGSSDLPTRLIQGSLRSDDWRVTHGLVDLRDLPDGPCDWTLLVQEMDKADASVAAILDEFRFLPHWILDDVMISEAVPGGSVGPHRDAYDVFLIQVQGHRGWELSMRDDFEPDERFELALIADWVADCSLEVAPGDVLYLPPGVGHHGVARDRCQTWSVGLRTPSAPELLFQLADALLEDPDGAARLKVSSIDPQSPDRIGADLILQARRLLQQSLELDDRDLGRLLASFLTRWRLWPGDESIDRATITRQLRAGHPVRLAATARLALLQRDQLFVNGEFIDCPGPLAIELARLRAFGPEWLDQEGALDQLLELGAIDRPPGPSVVR
jgi:50S ribosomal protein L16 3-hydroxylase